jgi:hypothetical protein
VIEPTEDRTTRSWPDPFARAYYPVAAAVGLVFVLIAAISLLIGLRQLVLPSSGDDFGAPGVFGPSIEGSNDALRSLLGALAFGLPGGLVLAWHVREGRRREGRAVSGITGNTWSRSLYLHLVALISLAIATGAVVVLLHSLRDSVWPQCFPSFADEGVLVPSQPEAAPGFDETVTPPPLISIEPPISVPIDPGFAPGPSCYPESADALRSALDAGLVAVVAGGTWAWHLRRGRRMGPPPPAGP